MDLIIKQTLHFAVPVERLFKAVIDPTEMTNYFISRSSGKMEAGAKLTWYWDDHNASGEVKVTAVEPNERIEFKWDVEGIPNTVTMRFEKIAPDRTKLSITEDGWSKDDKGIKGFAGNTSGWMNFLLCLKAWVEHGINLRAGSF